MLQGSVFKIHLFSINGATVPSVTSFQLATAFKRPHSILVQDIQETINRSSPSFAECNFELLSLRESMGCEFPLFRLTKDGMTQATSGFTSPRDMKIREIFITAFNRHAAPQTVHRNTNVQKLRQNSEADRAIRDATLESVREAFLDMNLSPAQLGKKLGGISPKFVVQLLVSGGFLQRNSGGVLMLTQKGNQIGAMRDRAGKRYVWPPHVVEELRRALKVPESE